MKWCCYINISGRHLLKLKYKQKGKGTSIRKMTKGPQFAQVGGSCCWKVFSRKSYRGEAKILRDGVNRQQNEFKIRSVQLVSCWFCMKWNIWNYLWSNEWSHVQCFGLRIGLVSGVRMALEYELVDFPSITIFCFPLWLQLHNHNHKPHAGTALRHAHVQRRLWIMIRFQQLPKFSRTSLSLGRAHSVTDNKISRSVI